MNDLPRLGRLLLCTVAMILGGCIDLGAGSPPARYYLLSPLAGAPPAEDAGVAVRLYPVELPVYLRRPQIVTRREGNEIGRADFDRWGEPLEDNVRRVVAENLALLIGTDRVTLFPSTVAGPADYGVRLEVVRFEGRLGQEAELQARWTVSSGDGGLHLARQTFYREPVAAAGYDALVAAMSRALGELSRDIAAALAASRE